MKKENGFSIIITLYNYESFIEEAIESVLSQTKYDFIKEIIVVDDGSTDNSIERVKKYLNNEKIKLITKDNGGQLSAFNVGYLNASGDYILFLDADDVLHSNFIERVVEYLKKYDVVFVKREYFGKEYFIEKKDKDEYFGFTMLQTFYLKKWIGSSTSAIVFRKDILDKILPLKELEKDWITRADDCLVFGSSLIGATKFFLNEVLVKYRIHDSNNYYNRSFSKEYLFKRRIKINRLFKTILDKNKIVIDDEQIIFEFNSKQKHSLSELACFYKIILLSKLPFFYKLGYFIQITISFIKERL